jgi:hypothetical protein
MPCVYHSANDLMDIQQGEIMKLKKILDQTTNLLCQVLRKIEPEQLERPKAKINGLTDWKRCHDIFDKNKFEI